MTTKGCINLFALFSLCIGISDANPGTLVAYQKNIEAIFTEERLRQVVEIETKDIKVAVENSGKSQSLTWTWPSDRKMVTDLGFTKIETPVDNQLSVSQFRVLTDEEFGPKTGKEYVERNYRSISAVEMEQAQKNMQAALQERVKKGELTAEQAKIAGGVGETVAGKERVVETIEGIADACRWVQNDSTLVVGQGDVFFAIYSDISADAVANKDAAIKLAKLIVAK